MFPAVVARKPVQFGPYLLTECVGQGGMAMVYKAKRLGPGGFEKTVVVKAMLPSLSAQQEFVAMFTSEARLMAQLAHPNIVEVHDFGVVDGVPYLVMEYLPGRNLSQLRAAVAACGERLPLGAALAIAREISLGLGHAHDFVDPSGRHRQVVHRDVSPSNVMVCADGAVKLLDFGVAKILDRFQSEVTQTFKGKYAYMAPEQVLHLPIDRRVDVFATGVILHELLTGKRLFAAPSELETLQRVSETLVVAPSVDNREVPRALDVIVKKALARVPDERYGSGNELGEALDALAPLLWSRKRLGRYLEEILVRTAACELCGRPTATGLPCGACADDTAPVPRLTVTPTPRTAAEGHAAAERARARARASLCLVRTPVSSLPSSLEDAAATDPRITLPLEDAAATDPQITLPPERPEDAAGRPASATAPTLAAATARTAPSLPATTPTVPVVPVAASALATSTLATPPPRLFVLPPAPARPSSPLAPPVLFPAPPLPEEPQPILVMPPAGPPAALAPIPPPLERPTRPLVRPTRLARPTVRPTRPLPAAPPRRPLRGLLLGAVAAGALAAVIAVIVGGPPVLPSELRAPSVTAGAATETVGPGVTTTAPGPPATARPASTVDRGGDAMARTRPPPSSEPMATPATTPVRPAASPSEPRRRPRPRATPAAERSVKDGRIVDPFAGMQ